jgi:hypothetical protein
MDLLSSPFIAMLPVLETSRMEAPVILDDDPGLWIKALVENGFLASVRNDF